MSEVDLQTDAVVRAFLSPASLLRLLLVVNRTLMRLFWWVGLVVGYAVLRPGHSGRNGTSDWRVSMCGVWREARVLVHIIRCNIQLLTSGTSILLNLLLLGHVNWHNQ